MLHAARIFSISFRAVCSKGPEADCCCWGDQVSGEGGSSKKDCTKSSSIKMSGSFRPYYTPFVYQQSGI